ncbi:MAG: PorT family protein [Bacteroidales bacterium]|jgi:hypothetical protein|nr:PorT family protein [Bacteroidales bacterium]
MKKIAFIIVVMISFAGNVHSQVHFGVKGGLNFPKFKSDELSLKDATGWHAGILLQFKVPIIGLGVQPELLYTSHKMKIDNISNKIGYFEVPVNVRWGFNLLIVRPFILAGPYFAYAVNFDGDTFKDSVKKFDWGIGLGGGIEVWKLQLGLRYSWGLKNVSDASEFDLKNNKFSLSAAILF